MLLRLLTMAPTRLANVSESCPRMHNGGQKERTLIFIVRAIQLGMRYVLVVKDVDVKEEE